MPEASITREEMFAICARFIEMYKGYKLIAIDSQKVATQLARFVDGSTVDDWAKVYAASVTKCGLVTGSPVESGFALSPQNPITRAEVAVVLNRAIALQEQ